MVNIKVNKINVLFFLFRFINVFIIEINYNSL